MKKRSKSKKSAQYNPFNPKKTVEVKAPFVLSELLKSFGFIVFVSVVVLYVIVQVILASLEPRLTLTSAESGTVVSEEFTTISGVVEDDANVSINDTPIITDEQGQFSKTVILRPGANTFYVRAYDRSDNINEIEHIIIYRP